MGFFSLDSHQEVYQGEPHEGKWSHELVGGAAAFEAMRKYEQYEEKEGKPANHALAKEILAGLVGAETDKLFETKVRKAVRGADADVISPHPSLCPLLPPTGPRLS